MSERSLEDRLASYGKTLDRAIAKTDTSSVSPATVNEKADVKNDNNDKRKPARIVPSSKESGGAAAPTPAAGSRRPMSGRDATPAAAASRRVSAEAGGTPSTSEKHATRSATAAQAASAKVSSGGSTNTSGTNTSGSGHAPRTPEGRHATPSSASRTRRPIQWPRLGVPSLAAALGGVGRTLIGSGLIILMFVGYQLWGTNLQESQAQEALQEEFEEAITVASGGDPEVQSLIASLTATPVAASEGEVALGAETVQASNPLEAALAEVGDGDDIDEGSRTFGEDDPVLQTTTTTEAETAEAEAESEAPPTTVAPTTTTAPAPTTTTEPPPPEVVERLYDILYKEPGEPMAVIKIPAIDVEKTVIEGVSLEDLKKGPGHYENSPLPGEPGNSAIAGHRTTYGAPFHNVDKLNPGDDIFVTTVLGEAHYKVMGLEIVNPEQVEVLNDFGDNRLTLTACHPKFSARQRIIVTAELVSEPIILPERPAESATITVSETIPATTVPTTTTTTTEVTSTTVEEVATASSIVVESTDELAAEDELAADEPSEEDLSGVMVADEPSEEDLSGVMVAGDPDEGSTGDGTTATTVDLAGQTAITELPDDAFDENGDFEEGSVPDGAFADDGSRNQQVALSLDEGLGWDRSALRPAILWAIAAGLVFFAALLLGRVWESMAHKKKFKRLFSYLVLSPVFFLFLWFSFFNFDAFLPAY